MLRTNSVAAALSAATAGMGLAPLPCGLADLEPDLVWIAPLPEDFTLDLWLLTHEDLRQTARIYARTRGAERTFGTEAVEVCLKEIARH